MSNTDNTLPAELQKEIEQKALRFTKDEGYQKVFIAGATEYAPYKVRYEQAERLLDKLMARHEAGLLPDIFIYNEIKSFLDGSK